MKKKRKFSEGLLDDKKIINELKITIGQSILDAGCGNGYMAKQFANLVGNTGKIYALDTERESINLLKKEVKNTNITALVGDISESTIFKDSFFDLVYLSNVFHIFTCSQIDSFSKEIHRILKSNGILAIVNIKKKETPFGPPVEMRSSPEELIKKVKFHPKKFVDINEYFYMQLFEITEQAYFS